MKKRLTRADLERQLKLCRKAMRNAEKLQGCEGMPSHLHWKPNLWDDGGPCVECRLWNRAMGRKVPR